MSEYPHYFKDVSSLQVVDVYEVCRLFDVNDAALSHALKKLLVSGGRGAKDRTQDVREARDTLNRWLQMHAGPEFRARMVTDSRPPRDPNYVDNRTVD